MRQVNKLTACAMMIAAGVLLPIILHMVSGNALGTILLPMHLPVLIAGLLLGPFYGIICAIVTPLISFMVSGMPPVVILPYMIIELSVYALIAGILYHKTRKVFISLICAQIGGRIVYAFLLFLTAQLMSWNVPAAMSVYTSFVTGIPGIVIQLLIIPVLVRILDKEKRYG